MRKQSLKHLNRKYYLGIAGLLSSPLTLMHAHTHTLFAFVTSSNLTKMTKGEFLKMLIYTITKNVRAVKGRWTSVIDLHKFRKLNVNLVVRKLEKQFILPFVTDLKTQGRQQKEGKMQQKKKKNPGEMGDSVEVAFQALDMDSWSIHGDTCSFPLLSQTPPQKYTEC